MNTLTFENSLYWILNLNAVLKVHFILSTFHSCISISISFQFYLFILYVLHFQNSEFRILFSVFCFPFSFHLNQFLHLIFLILIWFSFWFHPQKLYYIIIFMIWFSFKEIILFSQEIYLMFLSFSIWIIINGIYSIPWVILFPNWNQNYHDIIPVIVCHKFSCFILLLLVYFSVFRSIIGFH